MKSFQIAVASIAFAVTAGDPALAQVPTNPHVYSCSDYMAAEDGSRGQADAILFWATGYLQGRLGRLPAAIFSAESFGQDIQDVHAALMTVCPNVPDMAVAVFMDNLAGDFERSAAPIE